MPPGTELLVCRRPACLSAAASNELDILVCKGSATCVGSTALTATWFDSQTCLGDI